MRRGALTQYDALARGPTFHPAGNDGLAVGDRTIYNASQKDLPRRIPNKRGGLSACCRDVPQSSRR